MPRQPVDPKVQEKIRELRKKGFTQYEIADKLKISRSTVQIYAGGRVPATGADAQARLALPSLTPLNFYERCPDCGGLVQADIPCYLCSIRRLKQAESGKLTEMRG